MSKKRHQVFLFLLIALIAVLHAAAFQYSWYWRFGWYDIMMHFLGGVWVGATALYFFSYSEKYGPWLRSSVKALPFAIVSVIVVGLLWELFEFSVDKYVAIAQHSRGDTALDLVMDVIGALTIVLIYVKTKLIQNVSHEQQTGNI